MRAIAIMKPGVIELVDIPRPEPGPYDGLIKSECSFICNATDRKLIEGHFPGIGADAYPLILGHETVGIVESIGDKVRSFTRGDRVVGGLILGPADKRFGSGWGGNAEYVVATDYAAMAEDTAVRNLPDINEVFKIMLPVPADIPPEAAGLLCTWREVYAGFSDFRLTGRERIAIFGAGPVGLSFIKFAKIRGFPFIASVDMIPRKREMALSMGADVAYSPDEKFETELENAAGGKVDAVIDAVGSEGIINRGLGMIRQAGSVCVYGVVGQDDITLEKSKGPYNFNLFVHQWPSRDEEAAAQRPLCEWVREGILDWRPFVSGKFPLESFADAVSATRSPDAVKTMITYE